MTIASVALVVSLLAIAVAWTTEDIRHERSRDNHRRYPRADCNCIDCLIARGDV